MTRGERERENTGRVALGSRKFYSAHGLWGLAILSLLLFILAKADYCFYKNPVMDFSRLEDGHYGASIDIVAGLNVCDRQNLPPDWWACPLTPFDAHGKGNRTWDDQPHPETWHVNKASALTDGVETCVPSFNSPEEDWFDLDVVDAGVQRINHPDPQIVDDDLTEGLSQPHAEGEGGFSLVNLCFVSHTIIWGFEWSLQSHDEVVIDDSDFFCWDQLAAEEC